MNKYHAKSTIIDGIKFDSMAESNQYLELKMLEQAGEISDLTLQPKFTVLDAFEHEGKLMRGINYTPDFMYFDHNGMQTVVEVKGMETRDYLLRKKLFLSRYPYIRFIQVNS